jgi:D-arabinose 5-phosphate isomerase GutQ/predicted acetyltransferase
MNHHPALTHVFQKVQQACDILLNTIDESFEKFYKTLLSTKKPIITIGIGKSGHIAKKISATWSSIGKMSYFVHASEAAHGDLGQIPTGCCVVLFSYSGNTQEIHTIIPILIQKKTKILLITSNLQGILSQYTDKILLIPALEACPMGLVPTTSSVCFLMIGDALALAMIPHTCPTPHHFHFNHPGGSFKSSIMDRVKNHPDNIITITIATLNDYSCIQNMARFYVYDLSRECGYISSDWTIPKDGLYESFNFKNYFEESTRKAYLVKVYDEIAGFVLLNQATENPSNTWNMGEFFIIAKFQGKGIGSSVFRKIGCIHPGKWEVSVIPENQSALVFWEKIINKFTNGKFKKQLKTVTYDEHQPNRIIFEFYTYNHAV